MKSLKTISKKTSNKRYFSCFFQTEDDDKITPVKQNTNANS